MPASAHLRGTPRCAGHDGRAEPSRSGFCSRTAARPAADDSRVARPGGPPVAGMQLHGARRDGAGGAAVAVAHRGHARRAPRPVGQAPPEQPRLR
eukprot:1213665-Prymnesium_polylepis.1